MRFIHKIYTETFELAEDHMPEQVRVLAAACTNAD
jgi:hypothetical protein